MTTRVLMVCERFAPIVGGLERQALGLARELEIRGVHVEVLTRRFRGLPRREMMDGVQVHRVRAITGFAESRVVYAAGQLSLLLAAMMFVMRRSRRFDIMHVHGLSPSMAALTAVARACGWRTIAKTATARVGEAGLRGRRFARLRQWLLRRCDACIAISGEIADALNDDGVDPGRIINLPNFVDVDRFRPAASDERGRIRRELWPGWSEHDVIALTMSRLEARKGIGSVLDAIARLDDSAYRLAIAGDGPERPRLEAQVDDLRLRDRVRFLGTVSAPERYFQGADIFVLPSLFEGMPNSLLEALACGLAVVASRISGVTEIATDQEARLVAPGDVSELASALDALIRSPGLRQALGFRARELAKRRFARALVVGRYCDLYASLLAPGGAI